MVLFCFFFFCSSVPERLAFSEHVRQCVSVCVSQKVRLRTE